VSSHEEHERLTISTTLYADNGCGRRTLTRVAIDPYSISSPQLRGDFGKLVPAESHSALIAIPLSEGHTFLLFPFNVVLAYEIPVHILFKYTVVVAYSQYFECFRTI
jgi:hypothetical protein